MIALTFYLSSLIPGAVGASDLGGGTYRIDLNNGTSRAATSGEILDATKARKIDDINDTCTKRLIARFGNPAEQVSRSLGVYGASEQQAITAGIAATIDASNAATDVVLGSTTIAQVEAVTVTWPVI